MAAARKLKVFRTPIGFHDAYVAAPSQKAALEAWGSDHDLFARGVAERVTDAQLSAEPLANPGKIIKRMRGTAAEQKAALAGDDGGKVTKPAAKAKRAPHPSRAGLDAAEAAIEAAERRHRAERAALAREEKALAARRRKLDKAQSNEAGRLEQARERADAAYRRALARWREG
ncbi:hypothetical protein D1610_00300 [Sphingomonas gilva]|uniref:Cell envelope biogenesis protein TolA n=1 Tax=Sphingomonas gilva TaxID=2305907 RepID=A0A396RQ38_9SPHN|nr:hypothetical protein [Sphingomonas gilva]RHW18650.1 hypothetical protein D1610_00300 [Sphingomonas gilva]